MHSDYKKEKKKKRIKPKTGITFLELSGIEKVIITSGWQYDKMHNYYVTGWMILVVSRRNAI